MKERKINIEFLRILAMFLTIMLHVSNIYRKSFFNISSVDYYVSLLYNSISRICVPLFFMISGMFLIKEEFDFKKYLKRIKRFIIVLIIWSLIYYLIGHYHNISETFLEFVVNSFFNTNFTAKHLWFMYAIISLYIALPFIQNMCKNMTLEQENMFMILWALFSGFSFVYLPLAEGLLGYSVKVTYPVPIINGTYYLGYFVLGHILSKRFHGVKFTKKHNIFCIGLYIVSTIVISIMAYFFSNLYNEVYEYSLWYRGVFAIVATGSIFSFIIGNGDKFKNKFILRLSSLSFGVYLIHVIFLNMVANNFDIIEYNPLIFIPLLTVIIFALSLGSSYIIKKIPIIKNII